VKLSRNDKKKIESLLAAYPLKRALIVDKHRQYGRPKAVQTDRDNIRTGPGNPTQQAVQQLERDEEYQDALSVVRVVEDALPHLTKLEHDVVSAQFWSNRDRTQEGYAMMVGVSRRTFQRHLYSAIEKFAERNGSKIS